MSTQNDKAKLQRQMERSRESLVATVSEIKETVEHEVDGVKETVANVLNFREEFQTDPLVWSLGALSAGFALGYTVGYAHKNTKGKKQSEITAFADAMIEQLSTMGNGMVLPVLDAKISELFGFKFSAMLDQIGDQQKSASSQKKRTTTRKAPKTAAAKKVPAKTTKSRKAR